MEKDLKKRFPERTFYRGWTSKFIRKKIKERDNEHIPSPEEALEQMAQAGVTDVLIQPTHMLDGDDFERVISSLTPLFVNFEKVSIGRPLLEKEEDVHTFADVILQMFSWVKANEMAVFMGHGSAKAKIPVYDILNEYFASHGRKNFCVGTVEFTPGIDAVLKEVEKQQPEKVFVSPLLVVAGDHANHDMAGEQEDSWKNQIGKAGCDVECIIKGLGEYPEVRKLYVERAESADYFSFTKA